MQTQKSEYVFDNAGEQTVDRFAGLQYYFDEGTFRHLDILGAAPGWRCLEIGGGSGSVARISALRPGGFVLFEEFDVLSMQADPQISPSETMLKTVTVLWRVMRESGVDQRHGRLLAGILEGKGMQDVSAEGRVFRIKGGSPWAHVLRANCEQMHDKIIASGGLTEDEFRADIRSLDDPKHVDSGTLGRLSPPPVRLGRARS